ncbi:MAG: hypothetical protein AB8C13_08990 [Phycisphaerales bacterium]
MLKFIRKYQLIILAVGGSLLMVVFLFQPILGKLAPDPRKAAVASLADGTKLNGFDTYQASVDINILKRIYPRVFAPFEQGGLGLDQQSDDRTETHWMLLSKQANDAGLVGDAGEGRTWIPLIAQREAGSLVQQNIQQGLYTSQIEAEQALLDLTVQYENGLNRNVSIAMGMMRGMTEDDVFRTLATARGIERLYRVYTSLPTFSDIGAMQSAKERFDSIAVDAAMISADILTEQIPEPDEATLQAFFDQYKADAPSDNEFLIGYTQPSRVKLGWLTLDNAVVRSSIKIDRVELNKIYRTDRKLPEASRKYPGDFTGERLNIENEYRAEKTLDIMIEADKLIRSQIITATRGLSKEGPKFILPEDWNTTRPTLESIAQNVVTGLQEQFGIDFPLPAVQIRTDRWLDGLAISQLPGFGTAQYRIGQRGLPTPMIPAANDSPEFAELMTLQAGIPLADPAAEDAQGNRYYAIVYEFNTAGPADSIDDAGRERVLADYRAVKAYEQLAAQRDTLLNIAQSAGDLEPAISAASDMGSADSMRPGVARNLLVRKESVSRGRLAAFIEPGINTPEFRDAVLTIASNINPLATPDEVAQSPLFVAVPVPSAKGIAIAKVIAPRPMTADDFRAQMNQLLQFEGANQIREALEDLGSTPFSLESLQSRYGYVQLKKRSNEVEPVESAEEEAESDDA